MNRSLAKLMTVIITSLILTACVGSNGPSTQIQVTMTDFAFTPNTYSVPAGEQITLSATNLGAVAHSFVIMNLGHEASGHFTSEDKANVYWEQVEVPPGSSVQSTLAAPSDPGIYQIVCANAGHLEAGMVAKLVVVAQP